MEQEKQLSRIDDTNGETNPYQELIVNNAQKTELLMTQMEQWSIMNNVINYVKHSIFCMCIVLAMHMHMWSKTRMATG